MMVYFLLFLFFIRTSHPLNKRSIKKNTVRVQRNDLISLRKKDKEYGYLRFIKKEITEKSTDVLKALHILFLMMFILILLDKICKILFLLSS